MKPAFDILSGFWHAVVIGSGISAGFGRSGPEVICPVLHCPPVSLSCSNTTHDELVKQSFVSDSAAFATCYSIGSTLALGVGFFAGRLGSQRVAPEMAAHSGPASAGPVSSRRGLVGPRLGGGHVA